MNCKIPILRERNAWCIKYTIILVRRLSELFCKLFACLGLRRNDASAVSESFVDEHGVLVLAGEDDSP